MSFTSAEISILEQIFGLDAFNNESVKPLYGIYRTALVASPDVTKQLKLRSFVECLYYKKTIINGHRISEHTISEYRDLIIRFLKTYIDTLPSYVIPPYIFEDDQLLSIWCDAVKNNDHLTHIQIECRVVKNTDQQQQFLKILTTMSQLRGLTIVGFDFSQGGMQSLVEATSNLVALTALAVEDCKLDIEAGVGLTSIINTLGIKDLTLRRIMHDETITLGNIMMPFESSALQFLRLDNNAIIEPDLDLLLAMFSRLPRLKLINLENTHWGDKGVDKLTLLITTNQLPALVTLCLINNGITDLSARRLLQAIQSTPTSLLETIMLGSGDHFYPENTPQQPYETKFDWEARLESRYDRGRTDQLSYFVSTDRAIPNDVSVELRSEFKTFLEAKADARAVSVSTPTLVSSSEQVAITPYSSSTIAYFGGKTPLFPGVAAPSCSSSFSHPPRDVPGAK